MGKGAVAAGKMEESAPLPYLSPAPRAFFGISLYWTTAPPFLSPERAKYLIGRRCDIPTYRAKEYGGLSRCFCM